MGQHLVELCGTAYNNEWEILDACRGVKKLMKIEAMNIRKVKLQLYMRNEYQGGNWHWSISSNSKKLTFEIKILFWYMLIRKFVIPNKKITTDRNERKNSFSGMEINTPDFFKNSGIVIELFLLY